jgi:hypothetical protein
MCSFVSDYLLKKIKEKRRRLKVNTIYKIEDVSSKLLSWDTLYERFNHFFGEKYLHIHNTFIDFQRVSIRQLDKDLCDRMFQNVQKLLLDIQFRLSEDNSGVVFSIIGGLERKDFVSKGYTDFMSFFEKYMPQQDCWALGATIQRYLYLVPRSDAGPADGRRSGRSGRSGDTCLPKKFCLRLCLSAASSVKLLWVKDNV